MCADALTQIAALADVQGKRVQSVEQIDAGRFGQRVERVGRELRRQARDSQHALGGLGDHLRREVAVEHLHECPQHTRIAQRAMPAVDRQRVALDHAVEVVSRSIRKHPSRKLDRAKHARGEAPALARERVRRDAITEVRFTGSAFSRRGLTYRTFVRYRSTMSNDRSYLTLLQDYYARH